MSNTEVAKKKKGLEMFPVKNVSSNGQKEERILSKGTKVQYSNITFGLIASFRHIEYDVATL